MPRVSHAPDTRHRTSDVRASVGVDGAGVRFSDLGLRPETLAALRACGFASPSPVQARALPHALAGADTIVQAKAGTGKTLVFALAVIEEHERVRQQRATGPSAAAPRGGGDPTAANAAAGDALGRRGAGTEGTIPGGAEGGLASGDRSGPGDAGVGAPARPHSLLLAPTRELAAQTLGVLRALSAHAAERAPRLRSFVGGLPFASDLEVARAGLDVAIGTPGRLAQLMASGAIDASELRLLVLDEADKLVSAGRGRHGGRGLPAEDPRGRHDERPGPEGSGDRGDPGIEGGDALTHHTRAVLEHCPPPSRRQTLALSATFGGAALERVEALMRATPQPRRVMLCGERAARALEGVRQFYVAADAGATPGCIDGGVSAQLACVASVLRSVPFHQAVVFTRRRATAAALSERLRAAGISAGLITGSMAQRKRAQAIARMRELSLRVLISTDLLARGVDLEHVNLVISLGALQDAHVAGANTYAGRAPCASAAQSAQMLASRGVDPPGSATASSSAHAAAELATAAAAAVFESGGASTYMHRLGRAGRFGTLGVAVTVVQQKDVAALTALHAAAGSDIRPLPERLGDNAHVEYALADPGAAGPRVGGRAAALASFGTRVHGKQAEALASQVVAADADDAGAAVVARGVAYAGIGGESSASAAACKRPAAHADAHGGELLSLADMCASGGMRALLESELESSGEDEDNDGIVGGRMRCLEEMCSSGDMQAMLEVELEDDRVEGSGRGGTAIGRAAAHSDSLTISCDPASAGSASFAMPLPSSLRSAAPAARSMQPLLDASSSELVHAFFECGWADGVAASFAT